MKKGIPLLVGAAIAAIAAVVVLAACGSSHGSGSSANAKVVRVLAVAGPETDALIKYAPEFQKATGITASIEEVARPLWGERKVQALLQDSGIYDVVMIGGGDDLYWVMLKGHIRPLNQYLPKEEVDQLMHKNYFEKDGQLYGAPQYYNFPMLFYRKDLLDNPQAQVAFKAKYGHDLTPPKTPEELEQVAAFFNDPPKMYGFFVGGVDWSIALDYEYFLYGTGSNFGNLKTGALTLDSPDAVKAMTELTNMVKYNPPGWETESFFDGDKLFQAGKVFMYQNWFYIWQTLHDKMPGKVGMVPVVGDKQPGEALGAFVAVIPKVAPDAANAGKFIAWMLGPQYQKEQTLATGDLPVEQNVLQNPDVKTSLVGLNEYEKALPYMTPTNITWPNELSSGVSEAIWKVFKHQMTPAQASVWLQNEKFQGRKAIQ